MVHNFLAPNYFFFPKGLSILYVADHFKQRLEFSPHGLHCRGQIRVN